MPKQSSPTSFSLTMFLSSQTVPTLVNHLTTGSAFVQVLGKRKQPWTLSWFHGPLLYGDLLFSCASHFQSSQPPSYPPKLPSPNNRLKAIQLSPLYSMHFIFSLPCTSSLATPAIGSGGVEERSRGGVRGWVEVIFLGVP